MKCTREEFRANASKWMERASAVGEKLEVMDGDRVDMTISSPVLDAVFPDPKRTFDGFHAYDGRYLYRAHVDGTFTLTDPRGGWPEPCDPPDDPMLVWLAVWRYEEANP